MNAAIAHLHLKRKKAREAEAARRNNQGNSVSLSIEDEPDVRPRRSGWSLRAKTPKKSEESDVSSDEEEAERKRAEEAEKHAKAVRAGRLNLVMSLVPPSAVGVRVLRLFMNGPRSTIDASSPSSTAGPRTKTTRPKTSIDWSIATTIAWPSVS